MADQQEFVKLIDEYKGIIHKICHVYRNNETDREDLFQEIVIQLWKAWPKFRGESKLSTWMYRIALNTAITDFRKGQRKVNIVYPEFAPLHQAATDEEKEKEEQRKLLFDAIKQLTEVEKAIVMLYLEDKSYEEMEEVLGVNQNNLRVKMKRIKDKLRELTKNLADGN